MHLRGGDVNLDDPPAPDSQLKCATVSLPKQGLAQPDVRWRKEQQQRNGSHQISPAAALTKRLGAVSFDVVTTVLHTQDPGPGYYTTVDELHLYIPLGAGSAQRSMLVVMLKGSTTWAQSSKLCRPTSTGRARNA